MKIEEVISKKFGLLKDEFNERQRRLFVAAEAQSLGRGGIIIVAHATGFNRNTIARGVKELENDERLEPGQIRRRGAGRKKAVDKDLTLKKDLEQLVEPHTRGHPESSLRWTIKSIRNLSRELKEKGHNASRTLVASLLRLEKYSLQANRKKTEGAQHPDRNAQFEFIAKKTDDQLLLGDPVISVDAKKKELVGNFKNNGREWRPKGNPEEVLVHDFLDKELGKITPYGVYDLAQNKGWVNVGVDHNTAAFAVESIRQWWERMGRKKYENSKNIIITADAGSSNGYKTRLWKWELQKLANEIGKSISVFHFPPGTSKWNKIEHKLFSFISKNWRAKPLISHEVIVNLISSTKTETGLSVDCRMDKNKYPIGIKITDKQMKKINMKKEEFHGEWNYTICPNE
jgi:hypothetical protein